jgi:ABC-2 type transport system permease protein
MAVTTAAPVRAPGIGDFVRLKLRLMGNGFRGQTWRVVGFAFGLVLGLSFGGLAMLGLAASGAAPADVGYVVTAFVGGFVVLGWTLVPLLFFGVDETLDPARFALLPIRRGRLARGMLAAAFIGVPAVTTLFATTGLVIAAAIRFGALEAVVALFGVLSGLTLGVVASRAVTSAFAALLRSRRVRDLAAVIIALLATSVGPIQWVVLAAVQNGSLDEALRIARIVGWTPFGAPYVLPFDVADGRWDRAAAHAGITLASIGLLLWWWSRTLESAMLDNTSGGAARSARSTRGGAVDSLLPKVMRVMVRPGPFAAIMARESRFWWRDGRRRAALVSILMASAVLPIALNIGGRAGTPDSVSGLSTVGFGFAVTMAGTMGGLLLGNQFGYDGSAFGAHLLSRVRGRTELRARAAAIALVAVPVQVFVVVAVSAFSGQLPIVPAGLGLLAASFGAAIASAALLSVFAPYALPENANPFAMNSGAGSAKGMLAIVAMLGTLILSTPVAVAAFLAGRSAAMSWGVLVLGLGYGLGAALLGTYIAGDALDRRGPEILAAVTPKR